MSSTDFVKMKVYKNEASYSLNSPWKWSVEYFCDS